ncbi:hypothetical protein CBS101457_006922 [Exobasidium rhododendri]|nr:hypothetical protein CBS101457_006922 [Exobasidium rhododendri]
MFSVSTISRQDSTPGAAAAAADTIIRTIKCAVFALCSVLVAQAAFPAYGLRCLSIAAGLVVFLPSVFNSGAPAVAINKHFSFRGLVIVPILFCGAFLALVFLLAAVVCLFGVESYFKEADESASSSSSVTDLSRNFDAVRLVSNFYSFLWVTSLYLCVPVICLAYRFDAAQANQATVTEEDALAIIAEQPPHLATQGVTLQAASVPTSVLLSSSTPFPTFNIAFRTLLFVQMFGVIVDAVSGWQKAAATYPVEQSQLPIFNNGISCSVWPLLAYPVMIIAMLVNARLHSDTKLKSLWTYSEKWQLDMESTADDAGEEEEAMKDIDEVEKQM